MIYIRILFEIPREIPLGTSASKKYNAQESRHLNRIPTITAWEVREMMRCAALKKEA